MWLMCIAIACVAHSVISCDWACIIGGTVLVIYTSNDLVRNLDDG